MFLVFAVSACKDNDQKLSQVSEKLPPMTSGGIISYPVQAGGKWGFIDKAGKYVIKPQFDDAWQFSEGLAPVKLENRWGFIDKAGKYVINHQFDEAWWFSEGLAPVKSGSKWGFIDKAGRYVIRPQFENINPLEG